MFKDASRCTRKMVCLFFGLGNLKKLRRQISVGDGLLERAEQAE